ncbi:MAG TPA: hypothetical protein VKZ41_07730 [Gemmatimonadales bacterium]|nr:hypothetical protein [Gemmatimonadales bacterium]
MHSPQLRHRARQRSGFTTAELLIVIIIMGVVSALAIPRLTVIRDRNGIDSARSQLESTVTSARSAARQRSMPSVVQLSGSVLSSWTYSPTTGDTVWLVRPSDLGAATGVDITTTDKAATINFDTRGFADRADSVRVWRITIGERSDSVCIGPLGHLYKRNCEQ